jgi:nucleotide-binding universal stress UspA family protein
MKFSSILYPVDFSERCEVAAPFVSALAKRNDARLTLVNFVEIPALWYGTAEAPCAPDLNADAYIDESREQLKRFAKTFFPERQTQIVVEQGDPGSCIVEMARSSGIDLIMMPTRGRGRFRAALLGSVTAKVLHDSECPVWTAAHAGMPGDSASTEWANVVCAIDSAPDAARLIQQAKEMNSAYGSAVHLVHALPPAIDTRPEKYLNSDFEDYLNDFARETIDAMQKAAGTNFPLCLEAGAVSSIIAAEARQQGADLVLVGRGALSRFGGRLRTNVYAIIRDSPCPVLSL